MQTCIMSSLPRCIFRCSVFRYVNLVSFFCFFFFKLCYLIVTLLLWWRINTYLLTYLLMLCFFMSVKSLKFGGDRESNIPHLSVFPICSVLPVEGRRVRPNNIKLIDTCGSRLIASHQLLTISQLNQLIRTFFIIRKRFLLVLVVMCSHSHQALDGESCTKCTVSSFENVS